MTIGGSSAPPAVPPVVIFGASTGGTRTLGQILELLPPLPACLVLVQHMPAFINDSLARTFSQQARTEVRLVRDGEPIESGAILLAPSDRHCTFRGNRRLHLASGPPVNFVCPSIDVTMRSLSLPPPGQALIGVLLTGMGKDGAAGMAHMKGLGALTVAQDRASCAVYGMPAEAVQLGCVDHVLPPEEIARVIARAFGRGC